MSKKKGQHLVPACYLKSFVAKQTKHKNKNFEPGVYVSSKSLDSGWKMRGVNHDEFKISYFYNLSDDSIDRPQVENYLSSIERKYSFFLRKLINGDVDDELLSYFTYFSFIQSVRVEIFINRCQSMVDKLSGWYEIFSGQSYLDSDILNDMTKKQIMNEKFSELRDENARIICNDTSFPFITSDNPVVRRRFNKNDVSYFLPDEVLNGNVENEFESAFIFFPITPNLAYISSEFISSDLVINFSDENIKNILYLNYFSLNNSQKKIYSSVDNPFVDETLMADLLKTNSIKKLNSLRLYTEKKRFLIYGELISKEDNAIMYKFDSFDSSDDIYESMKILELSVIEDKKEIIYAKDCVIVSMDLNSKILKIDLCVALYKHITRR
ncbi:DUF4238 domain-containing protein [Vibrio metschnikovii]|uniref:DUF4238 domain-containing protein n=1 Tax=Vibrio metschnikovii TaxID=28172 RepID=UPI001C2F4C44|nr:DUF4238 domain-containing protein [Vibrio metschnikovii]